MRPPLIVQHQWGRLERIGNLAPLLGHESGPSTLERPRGVVPRCGCPHGGGERLRKQPVPRVERVGDALKRGAWAGGAARATTKSEDGGDGLGGGGGGGGGQVQRPLPG